MKLTKAEIRWDIKCGWFYRVFRDGGWQQVRFTNSAKAALIKSIAKYLKSQITDGHPGFSLRIYKRNGQLQQERTYPRNLDPRRSKG